MPAKRFLQPRISTRYSTAPTAKRVLMSIRGYDPFVQALRLHEPSTSVCTSRTLALCTSRTLAFCRSWPCLRNKLCSQKFLQDITPFPPANPTTHASHPNCRLGIHARLVLKPRISHVGRAFMPDKLAKPPTYTTP